MASSRASPPERERVPQGLSAKTVRIAIAERAPKSVRLPQLARELGLPKARRRELRRILEKLVERGSIEMLAGQRFRLRDGAPGARGSQATRRSPEPRQETARGESQGWLWLHPRGFGFVSTDDGSGDVFVPPTKLRGALHGDRVRVRAWPAERGREGLVLEVIERGVHRVAGTLERRQRRIWLVSEDVRLPQPIEVVGTLPLGLRPGDEVVAMIEGYPRGSGEGLQVRVLGALAPRGSAASEIERIEIREGVASAFGPEILAEAQKLGTRVSKAELREREDLRDLALVTIDPSDARDHDDAVFAERLPGGGFRLVIAIADVSHYVCEGSALDRAAYSRGTSIYLPDRVIPMLPFELSSQLASLVPDETRLALAIEVELGPRGALRKHRYIEAAMRSQGRLSYEGVARALGLSDAFERQPDAERHRELLETLWQASLLLRARRRQRGALELDLPEPRVVLDEHQNPIDVQRSRAEPGLRKAYGLIEDLMLLANELVASDLSRRRIPAIYRVHLPPDAEKIARFADLAASLGYSLDAAAGEDPRELARLLQQIEGTEHAQALNFLLLRAMQQASYDTSNLGHFALAARSYLHFTSPIRRYPDLAVHRSVRAMIRSEPIDGPSLQIKLKAQAANASRLERRAQAIDREVARLYGALLLRDRVGESFTARITSLDASGLWLTLEAPYVEVRCPIEALGREAYALDPMGLRLVAHRSGHAFELGDVLGVVIRDVSVEERTVSVHPEGWEPRRSQPARDPPRRRPLNRAARRRRGT